MTRLKCARRRRITAVLAAALFLLSVLAFVPPGVHPWVFFYQRALGMDSASRAVAHAGLAFWNPDHPLRKDWACVLTGTVIEAGSNDAYGFVLIHVHETLFMNARWKNADRPYVGLSGAHDFQTGERVLLFVSEYEGPGGWAVWSTLGSNRLYGLRIEAWDDPLVEIIRNDPDTQYHLLDCLNDEERVRQWSRLGKGLHSLRERELELRKMRDTENASASQSAR